jgi:hypothetical protein
MCKKIVFVPGWKDEVVQHLGKKSDLEKKGKLRSERLERLGILADGLPELAEYLVDNEDTEEIYVAHHPRSRAERASMRADQELEAVADEYVVELRAEVQSQRNEVGRDSDEGQRLGKVLERLKDNEKGRAEENEVSERERRLRVVAKCMRQGDPQNEQRTGSHIFKVIAELAIAERESADDEVIQKHINDLMRLFELDRDELLVRWHGVMEMLSAVDLDLQALERLLQGGNGASESKSAEYLKLILDGPPEGGFAHMARAVTNETEQLSKLWGAPADEGTLAVIVDFLERLSQLEPKVAPRRHSDGEVEPGLAGRLVEEAKGQGHYHDCVWKLSQHFAELAR